MSSPVAHVALERELPVGDEPRRQQRPARGVVPRPQTVVVRADETERIDLLDRAARSARGCGGGRGNGSRRTVVVTGAAAGGVVATTAGIAVVTGVAGLGCVTEVAAAVAAVVVTVVGGAVVGATVARAAVGGAAVVVGSVVVATTSVVGGGAAMVVRPLSSPTPARCRDVSSRANAPDRRHGNGRHADHAPPASARWEWPRTHDLDRSDGAGRAGRGTCRAAPAWVRRRPADGGGSTSVDAGRSGPWGRRSAATGGGGG